MEREYNFSDFSELELHSIAREILQIVYGYNFSENFSSKGLQPDLVQIDSKDKSVDVLVEIKGTKAITAESATIINKQLEKYIETFNPKKVILLCFSNINATAYSILFQTFEKLSVSNYEILQLDWIKEQLFKYPILDAKFDFRHVVKSSKETIDIEAKKAVDFATKMLDLNNSGKNFYAAGHFWGDEDKLDYFIREKKWENGHETKITNVVNRVKVGDVILIKSTYVEQGISILRIKAIGIVSNNPKNGHLLNVNWQLIKHVNFPKLGAYRSAISQIGKDNIPIIFDGLYEQLPNIFDIIHELENGISQVTPTKTSDRIYGIIDKDYFIKKHSIIVESKEFYFQNALNVLDQLKVYKLVRPEPLKLESKFSQPIEFKKTPYEQLNNHWKKKGKLKPSEFSEFLKNQQFELVELWNLISKFLSYVDAKAFDRQRLNDYEDKRAIANTGVLYEHLVDHFLQYALNNFEFVPEHSDKAFYRAIEYLQNPILFNIVSEDHRRLISNYFFEGEYFSDNFHRPLLNLFDQLKFTFENPENATCFYTSIIYSESIRKQWDVGKSISDGSGQDRSDGDLNSTGTDPESSDESDESINETQDKIPFHLDQVVAVDKLGREPVAKAFVNLIKNDIFTDKLNHSFMVHLQGEWGSGKSSFLNFIKKNLNDEDEKWIVVNYNAWQNQHISPPWWTLIDQIYRQSKAEFSWWCRFGLWSKENFRRVIWYSGWQKVLTLMLSIGFIILIFLFGSSILEILTNKTITSTAIDNKTTGLTIEVFANLLITLGSIIGVIYSLSKFISTPFFMTSSMDAVSFMNRASDPMNKIKRHFSKLVNNINRKNKNNHFFKLLEKIGFKQETRQLAIFIDDIDRCNKEFIVQLLEGIQTLFKDKRVLYIVAGDKNWITTSFGNIYKEFSNGNEVSSNLGELFLEKAFQLSFRMPNVEKEAKRKYWNHILGLPETEDSDNQFGETLKSLTFEIIEKLSILVDEYAAKREDIASPKIMKDMEKQFNLSADAVSDFVIEEKNKNKEELQHLLKDFHTLIDTNPRSIIRLANNYTMTLSTLIAERKYVSADKIFRWLVIEDLVPNIKHEIKIFTTLEMVQEYIDKIENPLHKENCNLLLKGNMEKEESILEIEEIKNIIGL